MKTVKGVLIEELRRTADQILIAEAEMRRLKDYQMEVRQKIRKINSMFRPFKRRTLVETTRIENLKNRGIL